MATSIVCIQSDVLLFTPQFTVMLHIHCIVNFFAAINFFVISLYTYYTYSVLLQEKKADNNIMPIKKENRNSLSLNMQQ